MNLTQFKFDTKLQPIITVILLGLSAFSMLAIENAMTTYYHLQLIVITGFGIVLAGIIYRLMNESPFAEPLAILFFTLSLSNLIVIFAFNQAFLPLAFGSLVNITGIVISTRASKKEFDMSFLETYEIKHAEEKQKEKTKKAPRKKK